MQGLVSTFGERAPGEAVALFGSTGNLIASVVNGSFAADYAAKVGQEITLRISF
jgi:S-adenosylmethionine hydrolase